MFLRQLDSLIQKNEIGPLPHAIYKITTRQTMDLKSKTETLKALEKHTGINVHYLGLPNDFLDTNLKIWRMENIDKEDFNIKKCCALKNIIKKDKRKPTHST